MAQEAVDQQETILRDLRTLGRELSSATEADDLLAQDPGRKLIRQMLAVISEYEKDMIVMKLAAARQRKRERDGRCEGRKPYGYRPGEPEVLERIYALRRKHPGRPRLGYRAIARILNDEGHPARMGGCWSAEVVRRIVRREWQRLA